MREDALTLSSDVEPTPQIPQLGQSWSNYRLRESDRRDADIVRQWNDDRHQRSLTDVVGQIEAGDGKCFIIEQERPRQPIGVLTLHECHLNFAFLAERRGGCVAIRAAAVLVARFFENEAESYLAAGTPVSNDGRRLLDGLGFEDNCLERSAWNKRAARKKPDSAQGGAED